VARAFASPLTGNVLVFHDESTSIPELTERIGRLLRCEIALEVDDDPSPHKWHTIDAKQAANALGTCERRGLSRKEAEQRLLEGGANSIPSLNSRSDWSILVDQFQGLPVALLAGAAVLSLATGGLLEAGAILAVVGLNAAIGFTVERRTEQTIGQLGAPGEQTTRIVRSGKEMEVRTTTIVPGDVILLQRGSVVPADGRLASAEMLMMSEAALTGESQPVRKSAKPLGEANLPLADRRNMVYRGTIVTGGSGVAIVVATGRHTEMGRIQRLLSATATPDAPSVLQMRELGRQLFWVTLGATCLIFGTGMLRGLALLQLVRSSLAVAVAAIPEGLPMVATTTLALGVEKMRRQGILVRRLEAIETLAAVNVICFDKTGTLTHGTMSLDSVAMGDRLWRCRDGILSIGDVLPDSKSNQLPLMLSMVSLCSDTEVCRVDQRIEVSGSSTEVALVEAALANGIDISRLRRDRPRRSVQHRSEAYRFMVSLHDAPGGALTAVKGSPADVLGRCKWEMQSNGRRKVLNPSRRREIEALNYRLAEKGLRVLGVAYLQTHKPVDDADLQPREVCNLVWLGLVALSDPVRSDVRTLMQKLHRAGIQTLMLTGDQRCTAHTIGNEVGLSGDLSIEVVDGAELDQLGAAELASVARRAHVFARITPSQKLRIVQSLQHTGAVVAMVGDGINDSPALRVANVGLAIGRNGDAAAREVADVFFANDRLGMLPHAIACGRATYSNLRKALHYLLSTNTSEILLVLAATAAGFGQILTPVQLLWINLVSDVLPGIGLAMGDPGQSVMDNAPISAGESILRRSDVGRLAREAGLITAGAFGSGLLGAARYGVGSTQVSTVTFGSLVTGQLLHALTYADSGALAPLRPPSNPTLLGIVGGSLVLQALAMLVPGFRKILGVGQVGVTDVAVMLAGGILPYIANSALSRTTTKREVEYQTPDARTITEEASSTEDAAEQTVHTSDSIRAVTQRAFVGTGSRHAASSSQRQVRARRPRR
jgi:Ca2+-transporting ATPase